MQSSFIKHKKIKPNSLEYREYQIELARKCINENILLIVPTGLGKTTVALLIIADFLIKHPDKKCLILAPTRPLCNQHSVFLQKNLELDNDSISSITGENNLKVRKEKWKSTVICATPQITSRDITKGHVDIDEFSLIIFDEAHRAVGKYSYSDIGKSLEGRNIRTIGMTASIPYEENRVKEILININLTKIESRDEKSKDVRPYVHGSEIEWIKLDLSPLIENIRNTLNKVILTCIQKIRAGGISFKNSSKISMNKLLALRAEVESLGNYDLRMELTSAIRLSHAINLLETQGIKPFVKFFERLQERNRGVGLKKMLTDPMVKYAFESARGAIMLGLEHPKINELKNQLRSIGNNEKAIVFVSFRDSANEIFKILSEDGFRVQYLIGKSGKGQSQREQLKTIEDMKKGKFDILISTQVGEEGLDISSCNLVVFYDNVSSAIRFIQRKGRTGRIRKGRIVVLITKGTKDEAYFWSAKRKLNLTKKTVSKFKNNRIKSFNSLEKYLVEENVPVIYVDDRESIIMINRLKTLGCKVDSKRILIGDFIISDDIVIERKTTKDFVKSVIDGRLFKQIIGMRNSYKKPLLIIEGDKKNASGIGLSPLFGALSSIISDFQISIFNTNNEDETAQLLYHIARREQIDKKKGITIKHSKKPVSLTEKQKYIISSLPNVNNILAERLLKEFKTLSNIFNSDESQLLRIEGIGKKLAEKIWELSNKEYLD